MENLSNNQKDRNEILLKYNLDLSKDNKIHLFGRSFVNHNLKNCKMVINDKEYKLCSDFDKNNINSSNNILEVKLKILKPLNSLKGFFSNCVSLISFIENNLDTSKITDISYMFYECKNLSELSDISNWNTSKITDMNNAFKGCELLFTIPDISKWDTSKVKDMSSMFEDCSSLISLPDISKWNMKNVTDISCMFGGCSCLSFCPDISKWNTCNINYMSDIFKDCSSLVTISDISKWNISNIVFITDIFRGCPSLMIRPVVANKFLLT